MWFLALKAFHVSAVMTWVGGMLVVAVSLRAVSHESSVTQAGPLRRVRAWDRIVTSTAMLLAIGSGIALATMETAFLQPWLMVKLMAVLVLCGMHGMLAGRLRRLAASSEGRLPATSLRVASGILACLAVIIAAVIVKPWTA